MNRFQRQLKVRNFLNMMESKSNVRIYVEGDELPDEKYFIQIPTGDLPPEIKVDGDVVNIGPFDTADAAQAAGGDLPVVNDEGSPVVDMTGSDSADDDLPGDDDLPLPPKEESARKQWMESLRKSVQKRIKEAEDTALDVDTDVGGKEGADDSGAGNYSGQGNPSNANATPADGTATGQSLDVDADRGPSADDEGSPGADAPDVDGSLDSNGGNITESGRNNEVWKGSYANVYKGNKQIDSGVVDRRTQEGVQIGKNFYKFSEHKIVRLA